MFGANHLVSLSLSHTHTHTHTHTHSLSLSLSLSHFSLLPSHSVALNILQDRVQFKPKQRDECNKNIGTRVSSFFLNTAVLILRGLQGVCDVNITQILRHVIFISRNNCFVMRLGGYNFFKISGYSSNILTLTHSKFSQLLRGN